MADKQQLTFVNSAGESFKLFTLNPLEEKIIAEQVHSEFTKAGRPLNPPEYEVTLGSGEKQRVAMRNLTDAGNDLALQAAWKAFELARVEYDEETARRFQNSCFLCVDADPDRYPAWLRRMKILQITIPEDEADKFLLFCHTWVIRAKDDIPNLIFACMNTMVKLSEEKQRAAEEMFRSQMEKAAESIDLTQ